MHGNRTHIIGIVLMVGAFIAGPAGALVYFIELLGMGIGATLSPWLVLVPFLSMLLSPFVLVWGWMLSAGRKELILFLRRFGNEALNDAVRDLVQTRLRRRFRLVTLDDSVFSPAGPRWSGLFASLLPPGLILLGIGLTYAGFARMAQSELEDETPFGEPLVLIQVIILMLGAFAFVVCLLLTVAAVRAHFASRRSIDSPKTLRKVLRRLLRLKGFIRRPSIAAPMAMVVNTTDALWQETVQDFASVSNTILLDITRPSKSICWELERVTKLGTYVVLLIAKPQLDYFQGSKLDEDESVNSEWNRLRQVAQSLPLVIYETPERLGETQLAHILEQQE